MAIKTIITIPNPILRKPTSKVKDFGADLQNLIKDLKDTLESAEEPEGAGIAATQIGSDKRICIVRDFFENPANPKQIAFNDYVLINPKIISNSKDTDIDWEGCLSVPDQYGKVQRYKKLKVNYEDTKGNKMRIKAHGMLARVIQHEIDHLDGILFTDKLIEDSVSETEFDRLYEAGLL